MSKKNDRIYWSCRRGMLELDLILVPFYFHKYSSLSPELQQQFVALLNATDVELYAWLTGRTQPEEALLQGIVKQVYAYAIDPARPREL